MPGVKGEILQKVVESVQGEGLRSQVWLLQHFLTCSIVLRLRSSLSRFLQHHRGTEPPVLEKPLRSKVRAHTRVASPASPERDLLLAFDVSC